MPPITRKNYFDQRDTVLITYGDMVQESEKAPLNSLSEFLQTTVAEVINTIHILPFFPYSSDDGFSVIDYAQVNPNLGVWADVAQIGSSFRLMFDAVVNHISAESDWFQAFLRDEDQYRNYFITESPATDLTAVFRPRALPLLTEVETTVGPKYVWTTFSADQIDLNFAHPDTLLAIIKTLLLYVSQGAELIRLDAIAYIWKEIGTSCIHLPQTHTIIQLIRAVLNTIAPYVSIITETNVPHKDNISYFGDGHNEAQMVYNFPLPPLTLHAFHPNSSQKVLSCHESVFALLREADNGRSTILCLHNVAHKPVQITLDETILGIFSGEHRDIISGEFLQTSNLQNLPLAPFQCIWLKK
jgi:sucrose phosphorylase